MKGLLLMVIYLFGTTTVFCFPRFHDDYKVSTVNLGMVYEKYIADLNDISEDMPWPCRKDICYSNITYSEHKGLFMWPEITVSQNVELRCPYSFKKPVYASRVCGLNIDGTAEWHEPNYDEVCPDPPMAELLRKFDEEFRIDTGKYTYEKIMYTKFIKDVVEIFTKYREAPVTYTDIQILKEHYLTALAVLVRHHNSRRLSMELALDLLSVLNTMMDDDLKEDFYYHFSEVTDRVSLFTPLQMILPYKVKRPSNGPLEIVQSNLALYSHRITEDTPDILMITRGFPMVKEDETIYTPSVFLDLSHVQRRGEIYEIAVLIIKEAVIVSNKFLWYKYDEIVDTLPPPGNDRGDDYGYHYFNDEGQYGNRYDQPAGFPGQPFGAQSQPDTTPIVENSENSTVYVFPTTIMPRIQTLKRVYYFNVIGSNVIVNERFYSRHFMRNVAVLYDAHACDDVNNCTSNVTCVTGDFMEAYVNYTNKGCVIIDRQEENGYISCQCRGEGSFAIFVETRDGLPPVGGGKTPPNINDLVTLKDGGISSFVVMSFIRELDILGTVLGIISLACLILTTLSYGIFRRAHRGTPTTILINLCVALISLSVLLFGIHLTKDALTMNGCTWSNALRYYLVFVTLIWNGIEAFNMYLMLVKVFNSEISQFARKAGIVAWGIPGLMAGAVYGTNKKAFYGKHILVSAEDGKCIFQCQLRNNTLYYGYLIPMAVIIIHNFIIFGLILNILLKHGKMHDKSKLRNKLVQLIGAVTTLVLLGVPWIFSAFGAVDATENADLNRTEGVFQVVFVIFVNLQGLFIFLFHCARNEQLREALVDKISSVLNRTSGSSNSGVPPINLQAVEPNTRKITLESPTTPADKQARI